MIEERACPAIVFGDALSGASLLKGARRTCNDPPQPTTRECSETMIAEAAYAGVSLNLRSGRVYGACAPYGTIDALPSLRLRKRERDEVLRRVAEVEVRKLRLRESPVDEVLRGMRETARSGFEVSTAAGPALLHAKHLAEKILTSRSALEGERKQVTVLFADLRPLRGGF